MANTLNQGVITAAKLAPLKKAGVTKIQQGNRGTLGVIGQAFDNLGTRFENNIKNKISYVKLAPLRLQRNLQQKLGVEEKQLRGAFPELYEFEDAHPKKTTAISEIQGAQERDREGMENTSMTPQERAVFSFSGMIKDIIINMLSGAKQSAAVEYHNNKNQDYKIDRGSELDNWIKKIFSNVKDDIKNGKFNVNSINNEQLNAAIGKHSSISGKNDDQLKNQVTSTIKQRAADKNLAKKEGFKAVEDALQQRKTKLEKYLKSTETNSVSVITGRQQEASARKIAEYKKELAEIDGKIAENKENNLKNDEERGAVLKGDIKEASIGSTKKLINEELAGADIDDNKRTELENKNVAPQKELDDLNATQSEDAIGLGDTQQRAEELNKKLDSLKQAGPEDVSVKPNVNEEAPIMNAPDTNKSIDLTQKPLVVAQGQGQAPAQGQGQGQAPAPAQVSTTGASTKVASNGRILNKKGKIQESDQTKTVANEPPTKFQEQQAKIELAKAALVEQNKQKGESVRAETIKNKEKIAENKITKKIETSPMGNNAFGSMVPKKSEKQSKKLIKDTTKKGASSATTVSNAKGGAKGPVASAVVASKIQTGKGI